jgi:type IX secretion system PorP/SprF family membrane protein
MKRIIYYIAIICPLFVFSQQTETYSRYNFQRYAINPAVGGSSSCWDIRTGYRKQWLGLKNQPTTLMFSVHKQLGYDETINEYASVKHGMGVYVYRDQWGHFQSTALNLSYAIHIRVSRKHYLSAGVFVGVNQMDWRIPSDMADYEYLDTNDPLLSNGVAMVLPDISPGIYYYSKKSWVGLSAKHLYKLKMKGFGGQIGSPSPFNPQLYFFAGKQIDSKGYDHSWIPSVHVKYSPITVMPSVDLNLMWLLANRVGLGVGYRNFDGFIGMVELRVSYFRLAYAFDYTTSKLRYGSSNTHEISLAIIPCGGQNKKDRYEECPAYGMK